MSLSDNIDTIVESDWKADVLYVDDVKEFIKRLKEDIENKTDQNWEIHYNIIESIINKLAGDKLI